MKFSKLALSVLSLSVRNSYNPSSFVMADWLQLGQDIDGENTGDDSGYSVSISSDGNRVAIGAIKNDDAGWDAGHTQIYEFINGVWVQLGQDIDGENANDYSGLSVSISSDGNRVAIGTPYNDDAGNNAGHVRVYQDGMFSPSPSQKPSFSPTMGIAGLPSSLPTSVPSFVPSMKPTGLPSSLPSVEPSFAPTMKPSGLPSSLPSSVLSIVPTMKPSVLPSSLPSVESVEPSYVPTKAGDNEWFIERIGEVSEQATSSDTILISLPFNATNKEIGALVFQENCLTTFNSDTYFEVGTTAPTSITPDGYIQFNTTLEMNITAINGTEYWNSFTDGTRGGWVEACVETFISYTDGPDLGNNDTDSDRKVDFKNNVLNITVSLNADYQVDEVSVVREESSREDVTTDYSEFITAYECDKADPYTEASFSYNQGDEITICVTDESNNIVQVEEFVDLVVAQDGINDYNFILGTLYNPDITTPVCLDATTSQRRVCYASIRALARFFESASPTDLTISGSVYVILDGRRARRNLRMTLPAPEKNTNDESSLVESGRRVEEEQEGGQFEVKVSLNSADYSAAPDRIFGSVAAGVMSMVIGGAALMV